MANVEPMIATTEWAIIRKLEIRQHYVYQDLSHEELLIARSRTLRIRACLTNQGVEGDRLVIPYAHTLFITCDASSTSSRWSRVS